MIRLLADEHISWALVNALRARCPQLAVVRVQDAGLSGADDRDLLAWAAAEGRAMLTHDRNTLPGFAYDRVRAGEVMTGVVVVDDQLAVGAAVDDLEILASCSRDDELNDRVVFIPLP